MSNFFCECKDSGEPPCFGLVQLRTDLAARDAELAALTLQFSEMRRRWQLRDLYATQQEERAEAAERQNDDHAAYIAGIERDRDEWKRKAEEAARDSARLDWLDATGHKDGHGFCHLAYGDYRHYAHASYGGVVHKSARETIDAALEAKGEA